MLGDENDGQERMISLKVSNDAENRQEILGLEYDCVSVAGQPQHLVVVVGQDTSGVTGDRLNIHPRAR